MDKLANHNERVDKLANHSGRVDKLANCSGGVDSLAQVYPPVRLVIRLETQIPTQPLQGFMTTCVKKFAIRQL